MALLLQPMYLSKLIALMGGVLISPFPALAFDVVKDELGNVYISGFSPNKISKIVYGGFPQEKVFSPNSCGVVAVKSSKKFPAIALSFNGTSLNWNSLPEIGSVPVCKNGLPNPDVPWGSLNAVRISASDLSTTTYIKSSTPLTVRNNNFEERTVKANSCGIINVKSSDKWPSAKLGTFYFYDGSNPSDDFAFGSLPVAPKPVCYKGLLYRPL